MSVLRLGPPNPLPCGCGAAGILEGEIDGVGRIIRSPHVIFCPLHDAAGDLLAALEACEVSMDTATSLGVGDFLPPAYRDSWAAAHTAARAAIAKARE